MEQNLIKPDPRSPLALIAHFDKLYQIDVITEIPECEARGRGISVFSLKD